MPHWPSFPPDFYYDLAPGNPFKLETPLPGFIRHSSWLTDEQRSSIEAVAGKWATSRAEAMLPPTVGVETVKRIAMDMSESYMSRKLAGISLVPVTPKVRKKRVKEEIEELAEAMKPKELTPSLKENLIKAVLPAITTIREEHKRMPTIEEQMGLKNLAIDLAKDRGVKITEEKGAEIVKEAIGRYAPVEK